ncbi:MAG: ABC transporter ATP-binding protein [archaeon]|nr:ABC transporter ATP-binding protein [archaeon]
MKIEIKDIQCGYAGSDLIIRNIDLTLEGPKLVCIIGPNGVGKSTLVKCINHLLVPRGGSITIDGTDIATLGRRELSRLISYVPASSQECFSMPVLDSVMIGLYGRQGWRTSRTDLDRVYETLRLLDLEDLAMRPSNALSAGQRQRVALARGLIQDSPILILDEPTANLDVMHQMYVTEMLKVITARKGVLVIMICHDLNIAAQFADEIVVMGRPGVVRTVGRPADVITPELIREVYGIDSRVITHNGAPHVILEPTFGDEGVHLD